MTLEAIGGPRPPAVPGPAPADHSLLSLEGLRKSRPARAVLGALLAAAIVAVIYLIVLAFTGHFTNVVKINAQLPPGSNAVPVGAAVEYRNVTIGKLGSEGQGPNGVVAVQFDIYPSNLSRIPKGVEAQVSPLSIFGNQYINLVAPSQVGTERLAAGDFIKPYSGAPSTSLQGTVTQLYGLLNAVHPADLDTALTAFATALNGEGVNLGRALTGSSDYLGKAVVPNLSTIRSDLNLTVPVSREIQSATPQILGILSNSTVTSRTITSNSAVVKNLLSSGSGAVKQFADILVDVETSLPMLLNDSGPLLGDITQSPTELAQTLSGLTQFAGAVANAESQGPYLSVNANLPVVNISAGVNAALGYNNPSSLAQALGSAVNPPTYTSANCPQYPGEANPDCGVGGNPSAAPVQAASDPGWAPAPVSGPAASSPGATGSGRTSTASQNLPSSDLPTSASLDAVQAIATALNGGQWPAAPGLATMILYPLLSAMDSTA